MTTGICKCVNYWKNNVIIIQKCQTNFKIFHMFMGAAILKIRLKDEIITNEV